MHFATTFRTLGQLLTLFSISMLMPLLMSWFMQDGASNAFAIAFGITACSGLVLWMIFASAPRQLSGRDGLLLTVLFWIILSLFGAIPFYIADNLLSIHDAVFESFSGFTTTGATVIDHIDSLPASIKLYRQMLQWLGGMGIVVLAVAILPLLGVNSILLYRAESPGPNKDARIAPRIAQTARILWLIYLGFTLTCALAYWLAGMTPFDAIGHSFSTVAIGGFSTHDASFAHFDNLAIELVGVVFMLLSVINYSLHYTVWIGRKPKNYWQDDEVRFLLLTLGALVVFSSLVLIATDEYEPAAALRAALFNVISVTTTTGFATEHFAGWPLALPTLLVIMSCIGGCAGSTCGGIKAIRLLLLAKLTSRELKRLVHPNGVFAIRLGANPVLLRSIEGVWAFFVAYAVLFALLVLALEMMGVDFDTAWSATMATLNNLGPGLGGVASNYLDLPDGAKWVLCLSMLLGRLEIFTLLVFISPLMWRN